MPIDNAAAIAKIDAVLERCRKLQAAYAEGSGYERRCAPSDGSDSSDSIQGDIVTLLEASISRLAWGGLTYCQNALNTVPKAEGWDRRTLVRTLAGLLEAFRTDYQAGRPRTLAERVHSELASAFLGMAEYLLADDGL